MNHPVVAILMGSNSDYPTMKASEQVLGELGVGFRTMVMSAHRTPDRVLRFAESARQDGIKVIIAAAGGAAHLAGVVAAVTHLPVLGVPMMSESLGGLDSLLSMVQMPAGVPVGTLAIGAPGAKNAALFAVAMLALSDTALEQRLLAYRKKQSDAVIETPSAP